MVAKWKFEEVEKLKSLIESYPVVGIVDMTNIPARQLQNIRAQLRGDVLIRMSKKRLIKLALEKAKRDIDLEKTKIKERRIAEINSIAKKGESRINEVVDFLYTEFVRLIENA